VQLPEIAAIQAAAQHVSRDLLGAALMSAEDSTTTAPAKPP
jgi:hypothetical protein